MSLERIPERAAAGSRPLLVSLIDAREILGGVGNTTIWKLIGEEAFETVAIGRRRYAVVASLESYVERLRAAATRREARS